MSYDTVCSTNGSSIKEIKAYLKSCHFIFNTEKKLVSFQDPDEVIKYDVRHEKTDLRVFIGVIPKEGWARVAALILLRI